MKNWTIVPNFDGQCTSVTSYKVIDENGNIQFIGNYTDCYYFLFPNVENDYLDKEAFDKARDND